MNENLSVKKSSVCANILIFLNKSVILPQKQLLVKMLFRQVRRLIEDITPIRLFFSSVTFLSNRKV